MVKQRNGPKQAMPIVKRLIAMAGPNLSSDLPGVKLTVEWPASTLQRQNLIAAQVRYTLQPYFPSLAEPIFDPANQALLNQLVGEIAFCVMTSLSHKMAQPFRSRLSGILESELVIHHRDLAMADFAGRVALALTAMAVREQSEPVAALPFAARFEKVMGDFKNQWKAIGFGESSWRKIAEAERRNIPWRRLIASERILQFGHGSRQVRVRDSLSEAEGYIATFLASNKHMASELLASSGLPTPRSFATLDLNSARQAARDLGYPVVVKPASTDFGIAVAVNLRSDQEVIAAFEQARRYGMVLIEQHVFGEHHRLLVMHASFRSAVRQDPAHVIGDGVHRIDELVHFANEGRSDQLSADLKRISIDDEVIRILGRQKLDMASVPVLGRRVLLREHSNLSVGGTYENVTDKVHPDNRLLAERAALAVGLKVAGIDFLTTDISRSYLETGGMICEINPSPGFVMGETGYEVEKAFFNGLFPDGVNGRIPIVALLSDRQMPDLMMQIESAAKAHGHRPVTATPNSVHRPGQILAAGNFSQYFSVGAALRDPAATAAVVQLTSSGIVQEGLIFDRCDLAIVDGSAVVNDSAAHELLTRHAKRLLNADDGRAIEAALHDVFGTRK
jgi:cyanophycin synthetase